MLPQNSIAGSRGPDRPLKAEREAAWSVLQGCTKPNPASDELTPLLNQKLALLPPQRRPPAATVCSARVGVSSRKAGLTRLEKLNLAPEKGHRWLSDGYTSALICCCSSCALHAAIWLDLRDPCAEERGCKSALVSAGESEPTYASRPLKGRVPGTASESKPASQVEMCLTYTSLCHPCLNFGKYVSRKQRRLYATHRDFCDEKPLLT